MVGPAGQMLVHQDPHGGRIQHPLGPQPRLGQKVDPNQEMVALGAANLAVGLFQGFPISSSTSRTPVAEAAGSKTQVTGVVGAVAVALVLVAAPDLLRHLPASALAAVVTPAGEVRDDASPELKRARRRVRDLEGEIERQMARHLRDPDVQTHLQDSYATFRENRPVLPIRADARRLMRGIVHDVSSSGTTVFIEPEDVVEAGNRLRIAQLEVTREIERLLLCRRVGVAQLGFPLEQVDAGK